MITSPWKVVQDDQFDFVEVCEVTLEDSDDVETFFYVVRKSFPEQEVHFGHRRAIVVRRQNAKDAKKSTKDSRQRSEGLPSESARRPGRPKQECRIAELSDADSASEEWEDDVIPSKRRRKGGRK